MQILGFCQFVRLGASQARNSPSKPTGFHFFLMKICWDLLAALADSAPTACVQPSDDPEPESKKCWCGSSLGTVENVAKAISHRQVRFWVKFQLEQVSNIMANSGVFHFPYQSWLALRPWPPHCVSTQCMDHACTPSLMAAEVWNQVLLQWEPRLPLSDGFTSIRCGPTRNRNLPLSWYSWHRAAAGSIYWCRFGSGDVVVMIYCALHIVSSHIWVFYLHIHVGKNTRAHWLVGQNLEIVKKCFQLDIGSPQLL